MIALDIDHRAVEKQKQFRRDLWDYKPVDHIPVFIWPEWSFGTTLREQLEDGRVQFEVNVQMIRKCLELLPDDYIPWARVTQGYMTLATMFDVEVHWGIDPEQPPGVGDHPIADLEQVYELEKPGLDAGIHPENLRRLRYHAKNLPPDVYISGIDAGGPLNSTRDLLETNLLYQAFYENPDALHHLLTIVTDLQLDMYHSIVEAVGGIERMTGMDFDPIWAPEKYKSFVSEDVGATISPTHFAEFSIPYNNRLFAPWGSGLLHNCGPNPSAHLYLEHQPKLKGLNLAYKYSRDDFETLRDVFAGWGMMHVLLDNEPGAEDQIAAFRYMMECFAPDVVAVPMAFVDDDWPDDDVTAFYWEMRKIADEYAANMKWANS